MSSRGSGTVTSAQPGDFLWAETTVPTPCPSILSHEGSVGWAGGSSWIPSLLPAGTWVTPQTCWALHGWPLVGTQLALSASSLHKLILDCAWGSATSGAGFCFISRALCRSHPVPTHLLPGVVPGWWCRVCSALSTFEPVPFPTTAWGAGCGMGRDRNS